MKAKIKVKYRKNSHEKYFAYEHELGSVYAFNLANETLVNTDVDRLEIVVEKM